VRRRTRGREPGTRVESLSICRAEVPALNQSRSRVLLLSMYPLDRGSWGPTVRIRHLRDELSRLGDLDVIAGYRGARRLAILRYAFAGRLRGLRGIYVESSSFLPAEADLALLALARALEIPVLTYVRDAYQLFDEYYPQDSLRHRIGRASFRPMIRALRAASTRMAFPTAGLASTVLGENADWMLLPPGAPPPVIVPRRPTADQLLFVGDARLPAHGADRLMAAVRLTRERGTAIELTVVARPGQEPPGPRPDWLHVRRAEGRQIDDLLPGVVATVIPRPRSAYNDLALPIKLYEYMAYGRPLLVTDCTEQARIVGQAAAGVVVADGVDSLAAGVARIVGAPDDDHATWSENARLAARDASWSTRATMIHAALGIG
jgi:hypothetical protein